MLSACSIYSGTYCRHVPFMLRAYHIGFSTLLMVVSLEEGLGRKTYFSVGYGWARWPWRVSLRDEGTFFRVVLLDMPCVGVGGVS